MSKKQSKIKKSKKSTSKSARKAGLTGGKKGIKKIGKKILKKKPSIKKSAKPAKKASKNIKKKVEAKKTSKKIANPAKKNIRPLKATAKSVKIEKVKKTQAKPIGKPVDKIIKTGKVIKPDAPVVRSTSKVNIEKANSTKKVELFNEVKKTSKRKKKKEKRDDDDEPTVLEDILVEQIIRSTKRQPKTPKVPKILKTFVNPMASLTVALPATGKKGAIVPKKEPKGKYELEYVVRTSTGILYELLTTPSGLSEWFADDVNIRDGIFTFFWDGSEQKARLIGFKEEKFIRMQWIDKPEGSYFEFKIQKDELTGDISLIITDFADEAADMQTSKLLWDSQVNKLLNVLGSN